MAVSKIPRICKTCGATFFGWTGNKGYFCSQKCYHAEDRTRALIRFWARVTKTKTCWIWNGPVDEHGYGKSGIGPAHQVSWTHVFGVIPKGLGVLHRCDNPPCVRPEHLFLGTNADNSADMVVKGRSRKGELHPMAIVTETIVRQIRTLYVPHKNGGLEALGRQFNIAPTTIHAIVTRKLWKHI